MFAKLHARAEDPNDPAVASFPWKTPDECPATNWYNMDEMGADTNKGQKKKVGHVDANHDGLKHSFSDTDGDNNPFHTTICLTTRADGATPTPPMLGHSNPGAKSKTAKCNLTRKYLNGICIKNANGKRENPTGIGVFVTKSGSMTKEKFPSFCRHFVQNRPLPGSGTVNKMLRADFNAIFRRAWLDWSDTQRLERMAGGNSILTAWKGTGLCRDDGGGGNGDASVTAETAAAAVTAGDDGATQRRAVGEESAEATAVAAATEVAMDVEQGHGEEAMDVVGEACDDPDEVELPNFDNEGNNDFDTEEEAAEDDEQRVGSTALVPAHPWR